MSYCYYVNDDKTICVPPKMADGRLITDYRSSSLIDINMQANSKQKNQYEFRQYLIHNGKQIADHQRRRKESTLVVKGTPSTKHIPEQFVTICQDNKCEVREINPNGHGISHMASSDSIWTPITHSKGLDRQ